MIKFKKNKKNKKNKKAFSFMELLAAIIIIGIIISIATIAFNKIRENSRDTKRIADIKQIQSALELYYSDNGDYPESLGSSISFGNKIYLENVPETVTPADGDCSEGENSYSYTTSDENNNYYLSFCIGRDVDDYGSGNKIAVPGDILEPIDICGQNFEDERNNQSYATIKIGDQCWMQENLNIGTLINSSSNQSDNSIIEKYCFSDNETNCDIYGGLYQWNEAMEYDEENIEGICPDGWHIPTYNDWNTLINFVKEDNENICDSNSDYIAKSLASNSNWDGWIIEKDVCCPGYNQTTTNNISNFSILPAGALSIIELVIPPFENREWFLASVEAFLWSSSLTGNSPYHIHLGVTVPSIDFISAPDKNQGYSVRCILD